MRTMLSRLAARLTSMVVAVCPPTSASAPGTACTASRRRRTVSAAAAESGASSSTASTRTCLPSRGDAGRPGRGHPFRRHCRRHDVVRAPRRRDDLGRRRGAARVVLLDEPLPDNRADVPGVHLVGGLPEPQPEDAEGQRDEHERGDHPDRPGPPADRPGDPEPDPVLCRHVGVRGGCVPGDERPEHPPAEEYQHSRQQRGHDRERDGDAGRRDRAEATDVVHLRREQAQQPHDDGGLLRPGSPGTTGATRSPWRCAGRRAGAAPRGTVR